MPSNHFSRKERQLKNHINSLNKLFNISKGIISDEINLLIIKIRNLIKILKGAFSLNKLKYIVGGFAIIFGLSPVSEINAQSFIAPIQNPFGLSLNSNIIGYNYYAGKTQFADMDGDGDLDLLYETKDIDTSYYSYYENNVFIYHENIGTINNPQFSIGVKNPFNLTSPQNMSLDFSVLSHNLVDMDNDGDIDILATYSGTYFSYNYYTYQYNISANTVFKYYENIGNSSMPLFAAQQTNPFGLVLDSIIAIGDIVDIDGDGDFDIISSASALDNQGYIQNQDMIFHENIGNQNNPQFSAPQVNLTGITLPTGYFPVVPSFGDLDGDGDFDLLTTPYDDNGSSQYNFLFQENIGSNTNPIMSIQTQNPFGLSPDTSYAGIIINSEMIDLDGDGDLDIVNSGRFGDNFMFFENNLFSNFVCVSPKPTGLYSYDVIDTRAKIGWNNMNDPDCMVLKYFVRYREVGTPSWNTKSAGVGNGLCNFGLNTVTKQLLNLTPSTTYEFRMKAFYCGGTSSNYSTPVQFTTADVCPDMTNLSVQTFTNNTSKAKFTWDTTGAYVFARITLRVDTAGANWQTAGGFGVYYPTLFVNKFGLQSGEAYRAQGRTFCHPSITAYRSPTWTAPVFWTQPGTIRLEGGTSINNLDIYPNPSRDVFNISFNSEDIQDLSIRILNVVGAQVYRETKEQFVGAYTKQISLDDYGKGIYFLEIETSTGVVNKKLILQ